MTTETLAERTAAGEKLLAIDGIVFDVGVWAKKHPGGAELLYSCSSADATDIFYAFHPKKCTNSTAHKVLARLPQVATIQFAPKSELQQDFELLRDNAVDIGLYKVCPWYYAVILSRVLLLLVLGVSLTATATTFAGTLIAGLVMALYLQQVAFVGHDCGHNSVTFSSAFDGVLGFIVGPLLTGVSISWWKHSHNVHHAETNHQVAWPESLARAHTLRSATFCLTMARRHRKRTQTFSTCPSLPSRPESSQRAACILTTTESLCATMQWLVFSCTVSICFSSPSCALQD